MSSVLESIKKQASLLNKRIVLPEGEDSRVVVAAGEAQAQGLAQVVVLPARLKCCQKYQGRCLYHFACKG